jgi:transposase
VEQLEKRIEQLELKSKKNSQNSSKPPSSDISYEKPKHKKKSKKKRKKVLSKTTNRKCLSRLNKSRSFRSAARAAISTLTLKKWNYCTHQQIELPEIKVDVIYYLLHKCQCPECGKTVKAQLPSECRPRYGPRLSALIAEMSGTQGNSRETVQKLLQI